MPFCSSGTQCPLIIAASLGHHVINSPHANPTSHIILTPGEPDMLCGSYFMLSAMQAGTTTISKIFGMTLLDPAPCRDHTHKTFWSVLSPPHRHLLQSAGIVRVYSPPGSSIIPDPQRIILYGEPTLKPFYMLCIKEVTIGF